MTTATPRRSSIKHKFITAITLLVALVIGVVAWVSSCREAENLTASMDANGRILASTLALAAVQPLVNLAYDELNPYLSRLILEGSDVTEVTFYDIDGKIVAHKARDVERTKLGAKLDENGRQRYIERLSEPTRLDCAVNEECVEYVAPIIPPQTSVKYGAVVIKFKLERLHEALSQSRQIFLLISMGALLGGMVLSILLSGFITNNLERLVKGTSIVATGDLSHRIAVTSNDEIGLLASQFNDMVSRLEQSRNKIERKVYETEVLYEVSREMNFSNDTERLVRVILERASRALKAEHGSMMLLSDNTEELVTQVVYGIDGIDPLANPPTAQNKRLRVGEGVAGMVIKEQKAIIVNQGHQDPRFKSLGDENEHEKTVRSLISVPLINKERATGVLNIVNKISPDGFNEDDQRLLEALANQAAMAIANARLYELAITDGLTKLYIHRYFQARLEEEMNRARRYHAQLSLILFDIDHFKKFNDTYGHQQGDIVLIEVAKLIKHALRDNIDIPARYGGEEFAVILPETDSAGAQMVAERLRKNVENHDFPGQDSALKVTISLGIASYPDHAASRPLLIKKADVALYHCKERGRNCSSIYNDTMSE